MKRLSFVLACLVSLGLAVAGSSAFAGDMNQSSDSGASSTQGNSSGGGY